MHSGLAQRLLKGDEERFNVDRADANESSAGRTRPVVALLESRMKSSCRVSWRSMAAAPLCVPAVHEAPRVERTPVRGLLDELAAAEHDVVIS